MATPAVSLKLRKFRRRFGITAPRVVVRSHVPWQWLAVAASLLGLFVAVAGWMLMQHNEAGEIGRELQDIRQQFLSQQEELDLLRSTAGTRQNAMSIERATQRQLLSRIKDLEQENAALKEDMLLFERLIPVVGDEAILRVENFRVQSDEESGFRYRLLVAFQPSRQKPEFRGRMQLQVDYVLAGGIERQLLLPEGGGAAPEYQLSLKHFLRREGRFELPAGAQLKGVEVRVFQGVTLMGKRTAQL